MAPQSRLRPAAEPVLHRLEGLISLSEQETAAVLNLPAYLVDLDADQDIVREGDEPKRSFAIVEGFACTFKITGEGRRQILALHLPGDMPDLQTLHLARLDMSIGTITACRLAFVDHEPLRQLCADQPRMAGALWRDTLVTAAISREWLLNVGRRDTLQRTAHLLCETVLRLRASGLAFGPAVEFPITQDEMADALGVSAVHTNRVLQELKSRGLVVWARRRVEILDWDALARLGDFDPAYLHLRRAPDCVRRLSRH